MRLPKSFNDITVKQYREIYFLLQEKTDDDFKYAENWARIISILANVEYDKILSLPYPELKNLIKRLDFILRPEVLQEKAKKYIAVNGWVYRANLHAGTNSVSQVINIKGFQKQVEDLNPHETTVVNMHHLLASIYVPLSITGYKYKASNHSKVSENMLHARMGDVYGTLFFYSVLCERLTNATLDFMKDNLNQVTDHLKEVAEWMQKNSSELSGVGKLQSTS